MLHIIVYGSKLKLSYGDKHLIKNSCSINAAIINAALNLIRQENKELQGMLTIAQSGGTMVMVDYSFK